MFGTNKGPTLSTQTIQPASPDEQKMRLEFFNRIAQSSPQAAQIPLFQQPVQPPQQKKEPTIPELVQLLRENKGF